MNESGPEKRKIFEGKEVDIKNPAAAMAYFRYYIMPKLEPRWGDFDYKSNGVDDEGRRCYDFHPVGEEASWKTRRQGVRLFQDGSWEMFDAPLF